MRTLLSFSSLLMVCLWTMAVEAAESRAKEYTSGDRAPLVVQLFTSQGCSSCPPADNWLGQFQQHPGLWQQVFPLAFHVTYWNDLGWRDTFSQQAFTNRQYDYLKLGLSRSVYTPQLIIDGEEWRRWQFTGWTLTPLPEPSGASSGSLSARIEGASLGVNYSRPLSTETQLWFAWVQPSAKIAIRRGENRGRQLNNPFAVLAMQQIPADKLADFDFSGELPSVPRNDNLAWVIWLQDKGRILQALGGEGWP